MAIITATAHELRIHKQEDSSLYWTPGAAAPYWTRQPWYSTDIEMARPSDFLAVEGFSDLEGFEDDYVFELEIEEPCHATR